jgi:hypothetical protein
MSPFGKEVVPETDIPYMLETKINGPDGQEGEHW